MTQPSLVAWAPQLWRRFKASRNTDLPEVKTGQLFTDQYPLEIPSDTCDHSVPWRDLSRRWGDPSSLSARVAEGPGATVQPEGRLMSYMRLGSESVGSRVLLAALVTRKSCNVIVLSLVPHLQLSPDQDVSAGENAGGTRAHLPSAWQGNRQETG